MGQVWQGIHRQTGMGVAIKVLESSRAREASFVAGFRREVEAVAALNHPAIVKVHDYGLIDDPAWRGSAGALVVGSPYLVMELAEGSLQDRTPVYDWEDLRGLALTLLAGLAHAHSRGLIHRDLKPANILLCPPEERAAPPGGMPGIVLTDFGIVHALADDTLHGPAHASCGTPGYMAPEQFDGAWRDFGPGTDLYALGIALWRFACGARPFPGNDAVWLGQQHLMAPLPAFAPQFEVPVGFEDWLQAMLAKRPEHRFQRAADAAEALRALGEVDERAAASSAGSLTLLVDEDAPTLVDGPSRPPGESPDVITGSERPAAASFATHWRLFADSAPSPLLQGAGLGLYGLRTVPLVGRDPERDVLWEALKDTREAGMPRFVALHGPAGCGKSRLAAWLCSRSDELGAATCMVALHEPIGGPAHGLGPMLARVLRCVGLSGVHLIQRVRSELSRQGVTDPHEWRAIVELIAPNASNLPGASLPSIHFRNPGERFVVVERLLARLGADRPVVIWLEDVQWSLEALSFVHHLLSPGARSRARSRTHPRLPVLVVATLRDDALAQSDTAVSLFREVMSLERASRVPIKPLAQRDRSALVRGLLGLDGDLAARVEARTAGNPLFAVQLVGDWVRRGLLVPGRSGFELVAGANAVLPDDLHAVWSDRIGELLKGRPNSDRLALELAAALGNEVDGDEWACACRRANVAPPWDLVEQLSREALARVASGGPGNGWSFTHAMLRESLERLSREARRWEALHRLCADMLHRQRGPGVTERLGRHLALANLHELALKPLAEAARERLDHGDNRMALALLAERQASTLALGLDESDPRRGDGRALRIRLLRMRGKFEEAEAEADAVLEASAKYRWTQVRPVALVERGRLAWQRGRPELAERWLTEAAQLCAGAGDGQQLADCQRLMGLVFLHRGLHDKAHDCFKSALEAYERGQDVVWAGACRMNLGVVARHRGDLKSAGRWVRDALKSYQAAGCRWGEAECLNELGEAARFRRDLGSAEAYYRAALEHNLALGSGDAVFNEVNLGLVLSQRGNFDEARRALEAGLRTFDEQGRRAFVSVVHALLLPCEAAAGDWRRFEYHLGNARMGLEISGFVDVDTAAELMRAAEMAALANAPTAAVGAYEAAAEQWRGLKRPDEVQRAVQAIQVIQTTEKPVQ